MNDPIRIRGARQHNLKGIDLDLPRRRLTVITGPSGSGKSSLALDTLFAEQKTPTKSSRSTVGTATEVYDYLRLLWSRVGRTFCPECDRRVRPDTVSSAVDRVAELPEGTRYMVAFPLPRSAEITHALVVAGLYWWDLHRRSGGR